ncbi:tetratricopeptide repeat protein [Nocardiopsis sp. NRRL B-16309]|uniref:tetratricopeptide repeat protein n=1 Tax=Nocardiopsis sp. NRRL B-16309 TaxID=1519494 RepID=UPI001E2D7792|nr:tetratricopeptide repeat protein [Nocardiopsis sp. NRRL B-16309]
MNIASSGADAPEREVLWASVRVGDADPRTLGVHPARENRNGSTLPPYVERDIDAELHRLLTEAELEGGAVLVEGDSTAGKTRAALHALQKALPNRFLFTPAPGQDLRSLSDHLAALPEESREVVWLDDLNRYLSLGEYGLTETTLQSLCHQGAVVMATLRSEYADTYHMSVLENAWGRRNARRHEMHGERDAFVSLLRRFKLVELERVWSPEEVDRASQLDDDLLAEAVAHHGAHGIAEYMAAGPELLRIWRRARRSTARGGYPRGYAVVSAAVDLARTGLLLAPKRDLLERAHVHYTFGIAPLRPESFAQALEWAEHPSLGASGLLVPADEERGCWRAFDYLVEATTNLVPTPVWELALEHASDEDECLAISTNAARAGLHKVAIAAGEPLARSGHPRAMHLVGVWRRGQGREKEAEQWFCKAIDKGNSDAILSLGGLLISQGRMEEAGWWYRMATDNGLAQDLVASLGNSLIFEGRKEEAKRWYRSAADAGFFDAMVGLAFELSDQGRIREAKYWCCKAIDAGRTNAIVSLGFMLNRHGLVEEAESWYRRGADSGVAGAMFNLGHLLVTQGRMEEGEYWYCKAADAGFTSAMVNLGRLLAEKGRVKEAKQWLRKAVDSRADL